MVDLGFKKNLSSVKPRKEAGHSRKEPGRFPLCGHVQRIRSVRRWTNKGINQMARVRVLMQEPKTKHTWNTVVVGLR